ncbi:hypothetical protein [Crocosphaera sp. Alani8]|uniref:hypothetical protein n=1 Tax=Crocosphaera sp. Alani8 TaxID=3038952 RepID=UPI00313AD9F2
MPLHRVRFRNNTTNARIIRTLATFTYSDGSKTSDPSDGRPGSVNIGPGEDGYRFSRPASACSQEVFMFLVWDGGSGGDTANAGDGYCLTLTGLELNPALKVSESNSSDNFYTITKLDPDTGNQVPIDGEIPEEFKPLLKEF